MLDTQLEDLMIRFLKRNFPVHRFKQNMRFKRTITLNGKQYFISDKKTLSSLYYTLLEMLKVIFDADNKLNETVLRNFLNMK